MRTTLVSVRYASLLNLLAGREIVPEMIQQACTPDRLATTLTRLLTDPAAADAQRAACRVELAKLRPPRGLPSEAAADAVLKLLDQAARGAYVQPASFPPSAEEH